MILWCETCHQCVEHTHVWQSEFSSSKLASASFKRSFLGLILQMATYTRGIAGLECPSDSHVSVLCSSVQSVEVWCFYPLSFYLKRVLDGSKFRDWPFSVWKSPRYRSSLSLLLARIVTTASALLGFATNTCRAFCNVSTSRISRYWLGMIDLDNCTGEDLVE